MADGDLIFDGQVIERTGTGPIVVSDELYAQLLIWRNMADAINNLRRKL